MKNHKDQSVYLLPKNGERPFVCNKCSNVMFSKSNPGECNLCGARIVTSIHDRFDFKHYGLDEFMRGYNWNDLCHTECKHCGLIYRACIYDDVCPGCGGARPSLAKRIDSIELRFVIQKKRFQHKTGNAKVEKKEPLPMFCVNNRKLQAFKFSGISACQALEIMSNGDCSD